MKNYALFVITVFFYNSVSSQIINTKVTEYMPLVKWTKTTTKDVLHNPEWSGYKETVNGTYIFDLDAKTSTFFRNDTLVVEEPITEIYYIGEEIILKFNDIFETEFVLNLSKSESYYMWYNFFGGYTRVHNHTKITFVVKEKS